MTSLDKTIEFVDASFGKKKRHFGQTVFWLLKLKPDADEALQIAAYAHDVERAFKPKGSKRFLVYENHDLLVEHQRKSAQIMYEFILRNSTDRIRAEKVKHLIESHEDGGDDEQNLLKDADSLSYFETNAPKHIEEMAEGTFPRAEVKDKFEYMYNRITSDQARALAKPMYERVIHDINTKVVVKDYPGYIFDFNGVLLWDSELHETAWARYSKKIRGKECGDDEMLHHVHGRTNLDILKYLTGRDISKEELAKMTGEKESIYQSLCLDLGKNFRLAPGAVELLNFLKNINARRTIATASEIGNLRFFFEHLNLAEWFDFAEVVYDDNSFPGKPAPDIYLKAAQKLKLAPNDCLVVEDSVSGIAAAHAAGIGFIVGLGPEAKQGHLSTLPGVNLTVVDFYQLLDLIKQS